MTSPKPPEREDRGTPFYVWVKGPYISADPHPPTTGWKRKAISVPVGWHIESDPEDGVVLVSTFKEVITPLQAYDRAVFKHDSGFRLVHEERDFRDLGDAKIKGDAAEPPIVTHRHGP
jgi:hypothetical protein